MTEENFQKFRNNNSFVAWNESFKYQGYYDFNFSYVSPGYYRIVIDNTIKGEEQTDFDGYEDTAYFDIEVYQSYE